MYDRPDLVVVDFILVLIIAEHVTAFTKTAPKV